MKKQKNIKLYKQDIENLKKARQGKKTGANLIKELVIDET